ncbi:MAG: alpha/beta hydrolase [Phycisphaerae bacterium]
MRRTRWLIVFAVSLVALYAAWLLLLHFKQEFVIYPRRFTNAAAPVPPGATQVWLDAADGVRLEGWLAIGQGRTADSPGPAVIYFHGNLDIVGDVWWRSETYRAAGVTVLMPEMRGYGRSDGKPTYASLNADADAWRRWLAARPEVDPSHIILHGQSIGAAIAIGSAHREPPVALITESAFFSMNEMAARFLVPPALSRNPWDNGGRIGEVRCPILILHGRGDWLVPPHQATRLHERAAGSKLVLVDSGHANFPHRWQDIQPFLEAAGIPLR